MVISRNHIEGDADLPKRIGHSRRQCETVLCRRVNTVATADLQKLVCRFT